MRIAMQRLVEPELLDRLPVADPRAIGSRRDLRRVNGIMGNVGLIARALTRNAADAPRRIVDLGAGDGAFSLSLARRLASRWPGLRLVLVDRAPAVEAPTLAAIRATGWTPETV
ncbi:MAG: methyltransferase domain-containing protein, partial [Alphaproteobacteria bacterium]